MTKHICSYLSVKTVNRKTYSGYGMYVMPFTGLSNLWSIAVFMGLNSRVQGGQSYPKPVFFIILCLENDRNAAAKKWPGVHSA